LSLGEGKEGDEKIVPERAIRERTIRGVVVQRELAMV
jgi:hypothetical protein